MTTFLAEATPAMPPWWHPRPSDLPCRPQLPIALDQAQKLGELVDERDFWRIAHRVLLGGRS